MAVEAQDDVQTKGLFLSKSHDVLGARLQILDRDWKVCAQTPTPGTKVMGDAATLENTIDFGVVKLSETCPTFRHPAPAPAPAPAH